MSDTQSVLDQMTAGIMGRKEAKAAGLTPVGMESAPAITTIKGDIFPFDGGIKDQVVHSARIIRHELAQIDDCLRSIERETSLEEGGQPPATTPLTEADAKVAAQKATDAEAQAAYEKFTKDFAAKSAAAKAEAFAGRDDLVDEPEPGWVCPVHDSIDITTLTSRKGRVYRACKSCEEFER